MDKGCGCLSLLCGEFRRPHSALADFREPAGLWMPGRRSFAYFSFAVERKVRRQQAKPQNQTLQYCSSKHSAKRWLGKRKPTCVALTNIIIPACFWRESTYFKSTGSRPKSIPG